MGLLKKKDPKALRKFDYKAVTLPFALTPEALEDRLDGLGAEGWELVEFQGERGVFKRLID